MDKVNSEIRGSMLLPVADMLEEVERAEQLHGRMTTDMIRGIAILTEEVGEAAQAALENSRGHATKEGARAHLREELIQVAAVALRMVEALDGQR